MQDLHKGKIIARIKEKILSDTQIIRHLIDSLSLPNATHKR